MGKRDLTTTDSPKRSKRQKRLKGHKLYQRDRSPPDTSQEQENVELEERTEDEAPSFENEEEVTCDDGGESLLLEEYCVDVEEDEETTTSTSSPNKLKTTPTKTMSPKSASLKKSTIKATVSPETDIKTPPNSNSLTSASSSSGKKIKKRRESGTSSGEERWLSAIESGKLDDVDEELKKIKDPKLMTARQRAMYVRTMDLKPDVELLMSLPTGYREKTEEDIQKAALKAQRRKQMADEKREKDKQKTMERLLNKKETKQRSGTRNKVAKAAVPMITYKSTQEGAFIIMPPRHEFPLKPQKAYDPPKVQLCGIPGCGKPKVYNCSKTNVPLCSFVCYRKNVQAVRDMIV